MTRRDHSDPADPVRLGDSMQQVVRVLRPDAHLSKQSSMSAIGGVFGMWEQVVGESMAAHVQPIKLNGSALVVEVDDPAWATQLKFLEQSLQQRLAEIAGASIDTIEVRVARRR